MTITIHLGVLDVPYAVSVPAEARRVGVRTVHGGQPQAFSEAPSGAETTGDVAEILEEKYHIMEVFYEEIGEELIVKALEHSLELAITDLVLGKPTSLVQAFKTMTDEVEATFKIFLDLQQLDGIVPNVPTKAALAGVNHRLKHPYAQANPPRPSFIDTGTYQSHFKCEVTAT